MRNHYILLAFVALVTLTVASCRKDKQEHNERLENCLSKITAYTYQGSRVYHYEYNFNCADMLNYLKDKKGNVLCTYGGFSGGVSGDSSYCHGFYAGRTNPEVLFERTE